MWPSTRLRRVLTSVGLALYAAWFLATVLLIGTRVGLLPRFAVVHETVVAGAAVLTVVGVVQLGQKAIQRLRRVAD
jgi:hypothetical protein